jgi:hypothetical protein
MARSLQQQLDDCDAAIAAIETGAQAYTIRGKSAQKAQLGTLYAQRESLQQRLGVSQTGFATVAQITRPT